MYVCVIIYECLDYNIFTDSQHIKDHDKEERYQSEEGRDVRQDALRGIHFVKDVAEAGRKENRRWAVEHEKSAKSNNRRQLL